MKKILKLLTVCCARALSESESQTKLEVSAKPTGRLDENEPKAKFEFSRVVVPAFIAIIATMLLAGCGTQTTTDTTPAEQETVNETETSAPAEDATDSTKESDETTHAETDADTPKEMVSVTLNEVAHSIFYAPMYVAIEEGYFAEEGIDLDLVTGFGADKVMTAVLSGEADIGFMGPETTVYTANEGSKDQVINFAQLTQRAGNFLVAREPDDNFEWSKLVGKDVLGGRAGG